jgi:arsenite methyltransferase
MTTHETSEPSGTATSEEIASVIDKHATSGGGLTEATYLDTHYAAMQPEYEEMTRRVGIQPGWHMLDAGCGGGSFLPLLAELVGPTGRITAIDIAPENIQRVEQRIRQGEFACPVDTRVADVTTLPFPDAAFDGLWCAAVTSYLSDAQLMDAFREFRRVVRPGGLIAVKEYDSTALYIGPLPPAMIWRWLAAPETPIEVTDYPAVFRSLGLEQINYYTVIGERRNPLRPIERQYYRMVLPVLSANALKLDLPAKDHERWRMLIDVDHPDHILQHEDFRLREASMVVIGRVPV